MLKVKAKFELNHGGRRVAAGESFEVNGADGEALVAAGFVELVKKPKPKKKTNRKTTKSEVN